MKNTFKFAAAFLLIGGTMAGCKKDYLDVTPTTAVPQEQILGKMESITSTLSSTYRTAFNMVSTRHDSYGQKSWDLANDLMGNDMVVHSAGYGWYNAVYNYTEWTFVTSTRQPHAAWRFYYDLIGQANTLLFGLDNLNDPSATQADIERVRGEALGIRAFAYFYLINYFQQTYKGNESAPGVPIYTSVALQGNPRGTVQGVYDQIISDLETAETLLDGKGQLDKTRMDVRVVQGFRARVALLMEDWSTAATYANRARQGYTPMGQTEYLEGFSKLSLSEVMWGSLIPADQATIYASFFSHIDISTQGYAYLGGQKKITKALYDLIPAGDVRKQVFNDPANATATNPAYNQLKFRVPVAGSWAADYIYMRASEMYLIEAEALARQGQEGPARTVLQTMVQARYPAYSAAGFSGQALIDEILLQRRIELWGEGFALMDIKRLMTGLNRPQGAGNHGGSNFNPSIYTTGPEDPRFIMKIPQAELDANESMSAADQNP